TRRGLHLARQPRMPRPVVLLTLMCGLVMVSTPARADDRPTPTVHVRPFNADARALVTEAAARSQTIREMVDRLEQSDLIVYIRFSGFRNSQLAGRIGMLSTVAGRRYVLIELACPRIGLDQMVTLGHELHHALASASEPSV